MKKMVFCHVAANRVQPVPVRDVLRVSKPQVEKDMHIGIVTRNAYCTADKINERAGQCEVLKQSRHWPVITLVMTDRSSLGRVAGRTRFKCWHVRGARDNVAPWTNGPIREKLLHAFDVTMCLEAANGLMCRFEFRSLSSSARHPKAGPQVQEGFSLKSCGLAKSVVSEDTDPGSVNFWCRDEVRADRKGMPTSVLARQSTPARLVQNQWYGFRRVFDKAIAEWMLRLLPGLDATTLQARRAQANLDGANWRCLLAQEVADGMTLPHLLACSRELNQISTLYRFLKTGRFTNLTFAPTHAIWETATKISRDFAAVRDQMALISAAENVHFWSTVRSKNYQPHRIAPMRGRLHELA